MRSRRRLERGVPVLALFGVATAGSAGCEGAAKTTRAIESDSAGIIIVTNPPADRPLRWRFERIVAIGDDGDGAAAFFRIPPDGVVFGPEGEIVVLDAGNRLVKLFDSTGRHVRSIGREGRGPGEFQFPASLFAAADGTTSVLDAGRRKRIIFHNDGGVADERDAPRGFLGGAVRVHGDAIVYGFRVLDPEADRYLHRVMRASDGDTTSIDEVEAAATRSITYEACGIMISLPPVFTVTPLWDARGELTVHASAPDYDIRYRHGGDVTRIVRRAIAPPAASPELARLDLGEGENWVIGGGRECTVPPDEVIEKRGVAAHVPLIAALRLASDGDLWVRRFEVGRDAGPIDIFDAAGHYRGSLDSNAPWPLDFGPDGRILALEEDDRGVQTVVLYRLVRP